MVRRPLRGAVTIGVAGTVVSLALTGTPAQAAQAATTAHCPTSTSIAFLPAGTGYLFPNLFASVSACGFVDGGAPYHFTVDQAMSSVQTPSGLRNYTLYNVAITCTTVTANADALIATGCQPG
ncbi:hypothetical protein [Streptomyces ziwulingensis]|uniref:Secreted protein n=1 Tax=Streptomyces ziwulingensis TaxID=1045501 RepID=A0ABP9C2T1_9ACTN